MITSVYKRIHPQTGIIEILFNTEEKWVDFIINRLDEEHKIEISFFNEEDVLIADEYIDMKEDFDPFEYMIYHQQEKDQITLLLVPRTMLLNHSEWIGYNSVTDHDMPAGSEI